MNYRLFNTFKRKKVFKLILGLGCQSFEEIKFISSVYSKAGCDMFDVNPSEEAINAVKEGIKSVGLNPDDFMICISTGLDGDIHTQKAEINPDKCINCRKCIKQCPQDAIISQEGKTVVLKDKCIGCAKCKCSAISYQSFAPDTENAIMLAEKFNIDCFELHLSSKKSPMKTVKKLINTLNCPLSLCLDRRYYSNEKINKLITKTIKTLGSTEFIIQADGVPMSGGDDSYYSTLQTVAMAHLVQNHGTYIMLSGGTNSKTAQLAQMCEIKYNGVSIGSYARKIIKNLTFDEAVKKAKILTEAVQIIPD